METKMKGGPAFPTGTGWNHEGNWVGGDDAGMTLRDYFAAKAMQGLLAHPHHTPHSDQHFFAEVAYNIADAMLKAREQ